MIKSKSDMLQHNIDTYGESYAQVLANSDNSVFLVRSAFKAFEGALPVSQHIRIGLNLNGGGRLKQWYDNQLVESEWRRGSTTVWSREPCYATNPNVDMLGLALNLDALYQSGKIPFCHDSFQIKTFQTFNDEFMSAMLLALWRSAKVYGISTLFFEQGVQQILDHITNTSSPYPTLPNRRPLTRRSLARVHSLVENNFHTNISVAKMAGLLEMNETSFSKSFTRSTGQTPFTYITAYRMKQAQSLLKLNYSVTDVAVSVGYANPSKFSAAFRRHVGITPSAWRKNNINCKK